MSTHPAAAAHERKHPYHLVDPSPWPIVGAVAALILAVGLIWYMHGKGPWLFALGVVGMLYTMLMWWRDIVREAEHEGHHTPIVQIGMRYGMIMFIASEVMFFVAWFWAYFEFAFYPREPSGSVWPPKGVITFDPFDLPFLNTLILLTSGTTITWAHHALLHGDRKGLKLGLLLTVILGVLFTACQAYEYHHAAFGFSGSIYSSTFFMATGFHGAHVIIGTVFLIVCLLRANAGQFTTQQHLGFEFAAWYWHFVDVVWLFLFAAIYVWGAGAGHGAH